jgi:hypothetical protein
VPYWWEGKKEEMKGIKMEGGIEERQMKLSK